MCCPPRQGTSRPQRSRRSRSQQAPRRPARDRPFSMPYSSDPPSPRNLIEHHLQHHCARFVLSPPEQPVRPRADEQRIQPLVALDGRHVPQLRSEEHMSELQSLMRISYAVFCLKKKITTAHSTT